MNLVEHLVEHFFQSQRQFQCFVSDTVGYICFNLQVYVPVSEDILTFYTCILGCSSKSGV